MKFEMPRHCLIEVFQSLVNSLYHRGKVAQGTGKFAWSDFISDLKSSMRLFMSSMRLFTELIMKIMTLIISAGEIIAIPIFNAVFIVKNLLLRDE